MLLFECTTYLYSSSYNHYIFSSHKKDVEYSRTPYMVITHCAKSLSVVYNLFQDFDLNKDSDVSKVFKTVINQISNKFVL